MTPNNLTPTSIATPSPTKQSNVFTPPPPIKKTKRNNSHNSPSVKYDSPTQIIPAFENMNIENPEIHNIAKNKKKKLKDESPSQALALSPERGSKRFTVFDSPNKSVGRNQSGVSQSTNKVLYPEYDLAAFNSPPPLNSTNDRKRKKQEAIDNARAKSRANIERIMQFRNGGSASIMSSNGKMMYTLVDKNGKQKVYKYKKSFEKAVTKQVGGFGVLKDLQKQFNSAFGMTPTKTKPITRPAAPTRSAISTRPAASTRGAPDFKTDRNCPPTHLYKAPNGINCTNVPPATLPTQQPTLPKVPSKQYKLINGHPELVYEYYLPSTKRKRFLQMKNDNPDRVYDQLLETHVPRLVKNLIGFPRKTLDRATGRFIN